MPGVFPRAGGSSGGPGAAPRAGDGAGAPPQLPGPPRGLAWGRPALGVLPSGGGNRPCSGPRTMAVVYSEAAESPEGVPNSGWSRAAGPGGGPAWRTPGGVVCRRRLAVAHLARGRGSGGARSRRRGGLRCGGVWAPGPAGPHRLGGRIGRGPGAAAFVVLPAACGRDAGGLGRAGLGRASAGRCRPPGVRERGRCRFSAVGCPFRRSRAAPGPPPRVSGEQVLPAEPSAPRRSGRVRGAGRGAPSSSRAGRGLLVCGGGRARRGRSAGRRLGPLQGLDVWRGEGVRPLVAHQSVCSGLRVQWTVGVGDTCR